MHHCDTATTKNFGQKASIVCPYQQNDKLKQMLQPVPMIDTAI
jgi:hypothetical protein